jgi:hypothetical protein
LTGENCFARPPHRRSDFQFFCRTIILWDSRSDCSVALTSAG